MDLVDVAAKVTCDKLTARHRDEMRGERHFNRWIVCSESKLLLDLGGVPVRADAVGVYAFADLTKEIAFLEAPARA